MKNIQQLLLNDPKVTHAWCMYDWANSVYSLTITTAVFPIYYEQITAGEDGSEMVDFLGWTLPNTVLYSYALSLSFLITAILIPLLSGIADHTGKKKRFLQSFAFLGALACGGMFFFTGENIEYGIALVVLASIGYSSSLVFYDAFLPEIATPDRFDKLSARGFSMGYIGSVILLIFNLLMIQQPTWFGLTEGTLPARISFVTVCLWWIGFSAFALKRLPNNPFHKRPSERWFYSGYLKIIATYSIIKELSDMKRFVLSFFFFNAGVQSVMYLASLFGAKELRMATGELILTVLIIQLVAIGGAYLFAELSRRKGNIFSISMMIVIWIFCCIAAFYIQTNLQFFGLAFLVGVVMGGIQSLSRATFSKLIPENTTDHASYFSFYDVTFNLSIVFGTVSYGAIEHLTGSMRFSALVLSLFFILGLLLIQKVQIRTTQS